MDSYDVIIIGTGAGGGTLARHLAPSGKRILLLERGDWLPREPQNWSDQDVFVDNRYVSPDTWYDAERQAVPAGDPLLRRRIDEALRRCALPAPQGGLRRASPPRRNLTGLADLLTTSWSRTTRSPSSCYQVHGARGEDPTEPPASAPYPHPAVSHEPRIQQLADDLAAAGHQPVPRAVRDHARRVEPAVLDLHPLCDLRRLPLPRPCEVRRRGAGRSARRSSIRMSRC